MVHQEKEYLKMSGIEKVVVETSSSGLPIDTFDTLPPPEYEEASSSKSPPVQGKHVFTTVCEDG